MKQIIKLLTLALGISSQAHSQGFYVNGGNLVIDSTGVIEVQGTTTSPGMLVTFKNITGAGKIRLKEHTEIIPGLSPKQPTKIFVGMNTNNGLPFNLPDVEINNPYGARIGTNVRITNKLIFTEGDLFLGNNNLNFSAAATTTGNGAGKAVITDGTGYCQQELVPFAINTTFAFPLGYFPPEQDQIDTGSTIFILNGDPEPSVYCPVLVEKSGGSNGSNATVSAQLKAGPSTLSMHADNHTNVHWAIKKTNIAGGQLKATGHYPSGNTRGIIGDDSLIQGFAYDGQEYTQALAAHNLAAKTITAAISSDAGQLFGMSNKFVLLKAKALLAGAFPGSLDTIMNDYLRANASGNLIPLSDPYRTLPYTNAFTHVNNPMPEAAKASVFANQADVNNNIVDWVFVELRTPVTTGSTIIQTRSALIQRDGDIVDVDGKSPLFFKNLDPGNYTVTIRHRNHLAISTNNAGGFYKSLSTSSATAGLDFTTLPAASILGIGGNGFNSNYATAGGRRYMIAGNANGVSNDKSISVNGSSNDATYIRSLLVSSTNLNNVYHWADVNLDGKVSNLSGTVGESTANDSRYVLNRCLNGFPNGYRKEVRPQ